MTQRLLLAGAFLSSALTQFACKDRAQDTPRPAEVATPGPTPDTVVHTPNSCLEYEPMVVTVLGRLTIDTFPGRPNYESVRQGDEPEPEYVLHLTRPICVRGKAGDGFDSDQTGLESLQVLVDDPLRSTAHALISREVVISGTLFGAETGHHHTQVLITATG